MASKPVPVHGLIWSLATRVCKLVVWLCAWMVTLTGLYLRKCCTHFSRLCRTRHASSTSGRTMASGGGEGTEHSIVEKIAKNVVQNVKSKEVSQNVLNGSIHFA